ncbi:MAG: ATPase, partial [Runella slithyformis]
VSDLTNATFLRITDYSANEDEAELNDLWEGLIHRLKEIVGS